MASESKYERLISPFGVLMFYDTVRELFIDTAFLVFCPPLGADQDGIWWCREATCVASSWEAPSFYFYLSLGTYGFRVNQLRQTQEMVLLDEGSR
jgi:hypothetical protein